MHNSSQRHKQSSYSMDWAFFCRESDLPGNFPLSILWNPSLSRNSSINLKVSNTENSITTIKRQFHQTSILKQHLQTTNGLLRGTQFPVWKWIFNSKTQPNIQFQHLALQWSICFISKNELQCRYYLIYVKLVGYPLIPKLKVRKGPNLYFHVSAYCNGLVQTKHVKWIT